MRRFAPLVAALATVPLLAFGPAERIASTHWAVIIGISDYIHFDDVTGGDLPGAEHDARGVRDVLLSKYGFPADNIRMILNREATRANIESALTEWLPERARPGDNVTVFYAGHGSQMWDESGDEDDGLDETLAPADVSPTSTEFDISDDDFGAWLRALPTDNVVVFLDNCSSGSGTRDVTPFSRTRQLGRDITQLEKPATVSRRALPNARDKTGFDAQGANVLELAAAQPDQPAVDAFFPGEDGADPFHGGAFTTFLIRELWRAPGDMSYEDAYRRVTDDLKRNRFEQDPYLSEDVGIKSLPLFFVEGGSQGTATAFLPVLSVSGSTAELQGGQALGITLGSTFNTADGARMVVESVSSDRSQARVLRGSVSEGDRATLEGYRFSSSSLRVNVAGVDSATSDALASALEGTDGVVLIHDEASFSDLLLRRRGSDIRVVGMDGAARHVFPAGPEGSSDLANALLREASAKGLGNMENPAQPFGLDVWLAGDASSFGIGENVRFLAEAQRSGYLTLVDLGTDGTVTVLFPNPYDRDNAVTEGQRIEFPTESMQSEIQAMPPAGRGMVRAFLTSEPLDIAVGDDFTSGNIELADLIAEAVRSAAGSVEGSDGAVRLDSWGSASVMYEIHN